ncbi:ATP-binding protein [Streptomyces sp. NPDC005931]|uniref:ATP-binding protein n=1 Tax=Streptomyces sp. NPDC005931 TaxID=3364737 RepID=UPI0036BAAF7A
MSLPLTRRIARTALLVAAGAAAGIGAAGSAAAAAELPATPNLGAPTALDGAAGDPAGSVTRTVNQTAADADKVVPGTHRTLQQTSPTVKKLPVESLTEGGSPARTLPVEDLPLR